MFPKTYAYALNDTPNLGGVVTRPHLFSPHMQAPDDDDVEMEDAAAGKARIRKDSKYNCGYVWARHPRVQTQTNIIPMRISSDWSAASASAIIIVV